jgi:hypothetical protein
MRTNTLISIVFLFCSLIQAQDQIKEGVYSLNGSISYYSETIKQNNVDNDYSSISILPGVSYFIFDQVELSLSGDYQRSWNNYPNSMKGTNLGLGLGLRYYFPCGNIAPFIGANGGMSWYTNEGRTYSAPRTNYNFIGGLEIFIAESAALEPAIRYSKMHYDDQFSINSFDISFGVKYYIL